MRYIFFCVLAIMVYTLTTFSGAVAEEVQGDKVFHSITPKEALRMLNQREDIIFLDVRTPRERAGGYIPGSRLAPFGDVVGNRLELPKDKPILLVCAVGGRSYFAGQILSKKGYREVYNLSGGVKNWYKSGLPLAHDTP